MKFGSLYKGITLIIQGKCVKYTMVYKAPNMFCMIFKQLEFNIKTIIDSFFFFPSNYVIKTFPTKINIQEVKLKSIKFELFIISKLNEIYIFYYFVFINIISLLEIKKLYLNGIKINKNYFCSIFFKSLI